MKRLLISTFVVVALLTIIPMPKSAEELPYTEGSVWEMTFIRTLPGGYDTYMKFLQTEFKQVNEAAKKEGLILSYQVGTSPPANKEDWDIVLNTNLKGAFNFAQAIQRAMVKQRSGRIINISSVIGLIGNAGQTNYAASKAGLIGFTKSLARELAARNITVNAIAPGYVATDMTNSLPEDIQKSLQERIPLKRVATGEDIAGAVAFLASDDASYITGQVLCVDGGIVM